ncbi:hypothetical protein ROZALSC1DRAFT_9614, partial [Rozella allomycis CSF55]
MLLGPSKSGKTTVRKLLASLLNAQTIVINPKAMDKPYLLGTMDVDTREWKDGVLTVASREAACESGRVVWVVLDGDVDPEWVEALNSVLDDNRLYTVPSGERIRFGRNVRFVFE